MINIVRQKVDAYRIIFTALLTIKCYLRQEYSRGKIASNQSTPDLDSGLKIDQLF